MQTVLACQGVGMTCGGFTIGFLRAPSVAAVVLSILPLIIVRSRARVRCALGLTTERCVRVFLRSSSFLRAHPGFLW